MKFLRLVRRYMIISSHDMMEYRKAFAIQVLAWAFSTLINLIFWQAIFVQVPSINGWSIGDMMVLLGMGNIYLMLFFIFGENVLNLSYGIIEGGLNRFLTRPINVVLGSVLQGINLTGGVPLGINSMLYFALALYFKTQFTIVGLFEAGLMIIAGAIIMTLLALTIAAVTFWVGRFNVSWFIDSVFWSFAGFPIYIYPRSLQTVLTILIPLGFVETFPAAVATSLISTQEGFRLVMLSFVLTILWFVITAGVWREGLKRYAGHGV